MKLTGTAGSVISAVMLCIAFGSGANAQAIGPYHAQITGGGSFTFSVVLDNQTGNLAVANVSADVDQTTCQEEGFNDPLNMEQGSGVVDIADGRVTVVAASPFYYGDFHIKFDDRNGHSAHGDLSAVGAVLYPAFPVYKPKKAQICESGRLTFTAYGPRG
jgi:hypothetical protein